ncbi:unnamed protein product [Phaedon cochleariae]|uniref:UDP-glucuronosyltransferase n=1 Tax=Phaedon cochleariae TaxID=80249 RepID=A0A9P0DBL0_PHACE|nr:unnamed protein product [Phaedon cochleariae]
MQIKLLFFITLLGLLKYSENARILASVFSPSYSHQIAFRPLWKELAKRGHEITLLTTNPMKDPDLGNIKQIDLSGSYKVMEEQGSSDILTRGRNEGKSFMSMAQLYLDALDRTAEWQLEQHEVKQLIQNNSEHFDLLIVEVMNPIQMAFSERFKVPFIGITPLDAPYRIHDAIGNYMHPIVFPDYFLPFTPPLTFLQRAISVTFNWANWYYQYYVRYPSEDLIVRRHFGEGTRALRDIEKDMSFLFVNVNPIFHSIRPHGLNTVLMGGGTHIGKPKPLPKEINDFVDAAKDGVIYLSLGSNIKSALLTDDLRKAMLSTLKELPYKILWKFEDDGLQNLPKNVKLVKWVPQQDLLAHPNVKLFITQCGLQSMEEAIFNHVPMVGMPFMGDQHSNAIILRSKGLGLTVDRMNLTKTEFKKTVLEVLNNPIYKQNVIEISNSSKDVDMSGLERAVWWTEYCIRSKGAKHLRNPAIDLHWYQFYLLDVIGLLLTGLLVLVTIIVLILKLLKRLVFKNKNNQNSNKKLQ